MAKKISERGKDRKNNKILNEYKIEKKKKSALTFVAD
jgi:hypothetical protein